MERRCPYCHETSPAEDPRLVPCAACEALHHAACFVEGGGCAGSGCRAQAVRLGGRLVPLEELARAGDDLEALRAAPRGSLPAAVWVGVATLVFFLVTGMVLPLARSEGWLTAVVALLPMVLILGGGWVLIRRAGHLASGRRRVVVRDRHAPQEEFNPIFGVITPTGWVPGVLHDQTQEERERLAHDRPALAPAAPPPERCPSCAGALREPDEPAEPLAFCFHCGASLGPEADRPADPKKDPPGA